MSTVTRKQPSRPIRRRPVPEMRFFRTTVTDVRRLTPGVVRIRVGGGDLAEFVGDGPDQRIKIFLPRPGQLHPVLPAPGSGWYAEWRAMPDDVRPIMRTYTLRQHHPYSNEVDIDFVLHGDDGPASAWVGRAVPGDPFVFYGPYADYEPTPGTDWQLILGDETTLPAIGAIVEALPADARALVFVEVADAAEQQVWESKGDLTLTWLHRGVAAPGTSSLLLDAVRSTEFLAGRPYVWLGGEAGQVKAIRRHLVGERDVPRSDLYFCGYWRSGRTEDDAQNSPPDDED